jgi:hypothetical protein
MVESNKHAAGRLAMSGKVALPLREMSLLRALQMIAPEPHLAE